MKRSRAFTFGAHCSNSLHGFSRDDKYVTSYFCIFFFFLLVIVAFGSLAWAVEDRFCVFDADDALLPVGDFVAAFDFGVDEAAWFSLLLALPFALACVGVFALG